MKHITWDEFYGDDDVPNGYVDAVYVAELFAVKPATIRVWAHRGKLDVVAYVIGRFDRTKRELGEGDRYAVYSRAEVHALARSKGIDPDLKGCTVEAAAYELGLTQTEVRILVAAGELPYLGRGRGGEMYAVREYAKRNAVELSSERIQREHTLRHKVAAMTLQQVRDARRGLDEFEGDDDEDSSEERRMRATLSEWRALTRSSVDGW